METSPAVKATVAGMTLQEKVGQIFVFTWKNRQQAINDLRLHPGGYIRIYSDVLTVARECAEIQSLSKSPLIIAADLERGIGGTIGGALEVITGMALGATSSEECCFAAGEMIGRESLAMGINMDYAPILDVNSNPANPVINTRSFGQNPHQVARLAVAFAKGLRSGGVLCCGKHFPGHGDSGFDSHARLGSVSASREQLDNVELVPFRAAIAAGVDSIMSAHLLVPSIEKNEIPATLSPNVMTGLLRNELGFTGVAISDAMDMGAISSYFSVENALPAAINAGCDQLIMPDDNELAVDIIHQAVMRGDITQTRLDEAVGRILTMKSRLQNSDNIKAIPTRVSVPEHLESALNIARQSVTLVRNQDILPFRKEQKLFCLSFTNSTDSRGAFLEPRSFADFLAKDGWHVAKADVGNNPLSPGGISEEIFLKAQEADIIVLAAFVNIRLSSGTINLPDDTIENLARFQELGKPIVIISFGSPYIGSQFPWAQAYACGYGATQPTQQAMAEACKGEIPWQGKMPVMLPDNTQ